MSRVEQPQKPPTAPEMIDGSMEAAAGWKTILMIDGHPDSLRALALGLAGEAYRLETAGSAESALRKLASFRPDLILIHPEVAAADGTRLARHLLADENLAAVPIVALAGMGAASGRFDGHVEMAIDGGTLCGRIRAFFPAAPQTPPQDAADPAQLATGIPDRRQATDLLEAIEKGLPDSQFAPASQNGLHRLAQVVGGFPDPELAAYLQQAARLSHASTARARGRFRSVIRLCRELADREPDSVPGFADLRAGYLDHRWTEMQDLDAALQHRDFAALRKAGHNLKGTGAAYGFSELTDIGRAIEAAAKSEDAATIEARLDQIETYLAIVRPLNER